MAQSTNSRTKTEKKIVEQVVDEKLENSLEESDEALTEEETSPENEILEIELQQLKKIAEVDEDPEPADLIPAPELVFEIGDDPVRLYLKEIGLVDLLNTDREFWLATRMQADRRIDSIGSQYPLPRGETSIPRHIYRTLFDELVISMKRVTEDVTRMGYKPPEILQILKESQSLQLIWDNDEPSYLRAYLDNGLWGKDELWDGIARNAFTVFMCFYTFPDELADRLEDFLEKREKLPSSRTFSRYLPNDEALKIELSAIELRGGGGPKCLNQGKSTPGGQRRKTLHWPGQLIFGSNSRGQYRIITSCHQV